MLTQETIATVKASLPILEKYGHQVTDLFYQQLFQRQPQLRNIFNMTHQKQGGQSKVLAQAIFQYIHYIDQLDMLRLIAKNINAKHASLNITPKMYEFLGDVLLSAMQEVLGEYATPQLMQAWQLAYQQLAQLFIDVEEDLYARREKRSGGFRGKRKFIVVKRVRENQETVSFYLKPASGQRVPDFLPGQYVALTVNIPGAPHQHTRNYSLSDCPGKDYLRITIRRAEGGVVSEYFHNHVKVDDIVQLGMPSGTFTLQTSTRPAMLIAGGIGITPLLSMYKYLSANTSRQGSLIHCVKDGSERIFFQEISQYHTHRTKVIAVHAEPLSTEKPEVHYDFGGYLTATILRELMVSPATEFYLCGPPPFMKHTLGLLQTLRVDESNVFYEFFGPEENLVVSANSVVV
ncbi:MAG TPA: NO-inducible flavohemoprotein [Microscillaceae bacterium]|nr:NO-inducible flavohemoprotein [Microscillaceae bacterium]